MVLLLRNKGSVYTLVVAQDGAAALACMCPGVRRMRRRFDGASMERRMRRQVAQRRWTSGAQQFADLRFTGKSMAFTYMRSSIRIVAISVSRQWHPGARSVVLRPLSSMRAAVPVLVTLGGLGLALAGSRPGRALLGAAGGGRSVPSWRMDSSSNPAVRKGCWHACSSSDGVRGRQAAVAPMSDGAQQRA